MSEIKPLTKFCVTHKRTDAREGSNWGAYIWAENYMGAWEKAKELEQKIPVVYNITIDGVFLGEIEAGIEIPQSEDTKSLKSLVPWFVYFQLDEYIETEGHEPDFDDMIKYFEVLEEFEICADIVKRKNSKKSIKL